MIRLLSPMFADGARDPETTVIVEMSHDALDALALAVKVALEDDESIPDELVGASGELWQFFTEGLETG